MRNSMIPTGEIMKKAEKVKDTAQLIQESIERMLKIIDEGDERARKIMEDMK